MSTYEFIGDLKLASLVEAYMLLIGVEDSKATASFEMLISKRQLVCDDAESRPWTDANRVLGLFGISVMSFN